MRLKNKMVFNALKKREQQQDRDFVFERKVREYLFRGDFDRHKEICKNLNVVESTPKTRGEL